jgi:quercetin dioxygenase-like cupin family protein
MDTKEIKYNGGFVVQFLSETPEHNTFKCIVRSDARTPVPHYHEQFDETVKSLEGTTTVILNGNKHELGPGESIVIPRGAVHQIANKTKETITFLCDITPGVFGYKYFRDIEPIVNVKGIPDMEHFKKVMLRHGLVPVLSIKQSLVFGLLRIIRMFKK